MSKSIFVIDTQENCRNCLFCRGLNVCKLKKYLEGEGVTSIWTVDQQVLKGGKPKWCPLKPLPENQRR